jgi:Leucine-rich repeat (LRR) protein
MRFALLIVLASTMTAIAADTPTAEEKTAMDFVARSGGKATLDPHLSTEARVSAKFEAVSDVILMALKKYPRIGGVDAFDATRCTDKGLAALKELPNLRKLVFGKANLSTEGVSAIGQCTELRHLALVNANLSDAELLNLNKHTMLEQLTLSNNPKITDKGMQTVKEFDRLRVLYLGNTSITDEGLMELKVLDGLRTLGVGGTKVTQDAAEKFADMMPNLRAVRR